MGKKKEKRKFELFSQGRGFRPWLNNDGNKKGPCLPRFFLMEEKIKCYFHVGVFRGRKRFF